MELSKYIKEILMSRDNVIIPNFGAFEKTMLSARIDTITGEMHPPQTGVMFNPNLKIDSGILISYVAEKEKISQEKAVEEIHALVLSWEETLNQGQPVQIIGIGKLEKDGSGNIVYESTITASDFPDSFGLPVITVQENKEIPKAEEVQKDIKKPEEKKLEQKKPEIKKAPLKQKQTPVSESKKTPKTNKSLIPALLIVVPLVVIGVLVYLNFDFVKQKLKDTSHYVSGLVSGNESDTLTTANIITNDSLNAVDSSLVQVTEILENYTIVDESTNSRISIDQSNIENYNKVHIIAGSYRTKSNATRQRSKLVNKGFSAEVLHENKGLYRVSVASFSDVASAANDFERIKTIDDSLDYWLLVSK